MGNFITQTSTLFDDFSEGIKQAARDLANTILAELANALIAQPIVNFLNQFAQIGAQTLTNFFVPTPQGADGFFRTRQSGGPARGLTLVGEAGPELVNFGRSAYVHPNRDLARLGATGFTMVNNWNISGSDEATVRNAIIEAAPLLTEAAKRGMIEDVGRPSQVRSAFRG